MSGDGSISLPFADGTHVFRLRIGELRELEAKRDSGMIEVYNRLTSLRFRVDDITEVLRLGLIGGGMASPLALGLVAKYVGPTTFLPNCLIARAVLGAAIMGDEADPVGKELAETLAGMPSTRSTSEPGVTDSRQSSETPPPWDGRQGTSTDAAYGNSPPPLTDGDGRTVPTTTYRLPKE
jgi:tail tube GTA-gp10-like protein